MLSAWQVTCYCIPFPLLKKIQIDVSTLRGLPLAESENLERLELTDNQIYDITPLAGLKNLKWFYIARNRIDDVSPLTKLVNLYELHLSENQIHDILPLVNNPGLGRGDVIFVKSNPLNEVSMKNHIHGLRARGVHLSLD